MELLVFDLDGTLLNGASEISPYTRDTLRMLADRDVAYTVATGRSLHASKAVLDGHNFRLPHALKNGVMIWDPIANAFEHDNHLTLQQIERVLEAVLAVKVTPFIFTLEPGDRHGIYHPPLRNEAEERLVKLWFARDNVQIHPASRLPGDSEITNISAMGPTASIDQIVTTVAEQPHLVAYSGFAFEDESRKWIDIHNSNASKGGAVELLRSRLGVSKVVCFGDNDNDLSMFEVADECYAPANATAEIRSAATDVIDANTEDGVARFLRARFGLG